MSRSLLVKILIMTVLAIILVLQGPSALASSLSDDTANVGEAAECAVMRGFECKQARDARDWAISVTAWRFPESELKHNDMADAFRHCAWMGALATRLGQSGAYHVGYVHEEYAKGPAAERSMDLWNNLIGADIGEAAKAGNYDDQWGYVLEQCESRARAHELYGMGGVKGNY